MFIANPIKKEILSFFSYKKLLKILKYNIKLRKEFYLNNSELDKFFSKNKEIKNDKLYIDIINKYKFILFIEIEREIKQNENEFYNLFAREDIFNSSKTIIYINELNIQFINKIKINNKNNKIIIASNEIITKTLKNMFYKLNYIKKLDFFKFNTKNIFDMNHMFYNCSSLISLDISQFNTENVIDMKYMFCGCSSLSYINLNHFITKNVTNMEGMFNGCNCLTSIDISNFDTSKVTNMRDMFFCCYNLSNIKLDNFNTSNVKDMNSMFYKCFSLISLDLSNFDISNIINMLYIFRGCNSLNSIIINSNQIDLFKEKLEEIYFTKIKIKF